MTTALVTGGSGLVGRALVARLRADGVRVLATARSYPSERAVIEAGAEPLHTDAEGLGSWAREIADVEIVYHLGLPRIDAAAASRRRAAGGRGRRPRAPRPCARPSATARW